MFWFISENKSLHWTRLLGKFYWVLYLFCGVKAYAEYLIYHTKTLRKGFRFRIDGTGGTEFAIVPLHRCFLVQWPAGTSLNCSANKQQYIYSMCCFLVRLLAGTSLNCSVPWDSIVVQWCLLTFGLVLLVSHFNNSLVYKSYCKLTINNIILHVSYYFPSR